MNVVVFKKNKWSFFLKFHDIIILYMYISFVSEPKVLHLVIGNISGFLTTFDISLVKLYWISFFLLQCIDHRKLRIYSWLENCYMPFCKKWLIEPSDTKSWLDEDIVWKLPGNSCAAEIECRNESFFSWCFLRISEECFRLYCSNGSERALELDLTLEKSEQLQYCSDFAPPPLAKI